MAVLNKAVDKQSLKGLSPLGKLTPDKIDDIISKSRVENLPAGRTVFRAGDANTHKIYLLSGQIEISTTGKSRKKIIKSKSVEAKFPIADDVPRKATAKTKTASSLLYIDASLLEILLDENPSGEYEVTEIHVAQHSTDWMMRFLQSRAFLKIPTENIQKVLMGMEEIHVKKDEVVIQQGDEGDYYYIIKNGQCSVLRRPAEKLDEVRLALLAEGDGFGEESLISNSKRNATVKMLEDGTLMRLKKADFLSLLVKPLIRNVHLNSLKSPLYKNCQAIDIRNNDEFKAGSLENAKHIPLSMLRLRIPTLDAAKQYLIYSSNKDDAGAAAFLLAQHGIESYVLLGKIETYTKTAIVGDEQKPNKIDIVKLKTTSTPANKETITSSSNTSHLESESSQSRTQAPAPTAEASADHSRQTTSITDSTDQTKQLRQVQLAAKKQAEKMLAEAEAIRQSAIEEASKLKSRLKKEETSRLRSELESTRNKAEAAIQKSSQLAEQIRRQAEQDGSQIRQQAMFEVEKLRAEIDQLRQEEVEMKLQLESEILQIRQQTALQAQQEAEQEAIKARMAAEEAAQSVKRIAMKEAEATRSKAQKEAEKARLAAISEAKSTLAAAEQAAIEAQIRAESLTAEAKKLELDAENARSKALQEAQAIRKAALEEAERIKQNALDEYNKIKGKTEHKTVSIISHDNIFDLDEELSPTISQTAAMPFADEASTALEMAKEIRQKLLEVEEQRIENERRSLLDRKKQEVTVKKMKGKTILETENEVFIFQEPKERKNYVKTFNDHISTGILTANTVSKKPDVPAATESQIIFPAVNNQQPENFTLSPIAPLYEQQEIDKTRKSLFAIAASILLVVALSLVAYTTKIQINFTEVDALVNQGSPESEKENIRNKARKEFQKKLSAIRR